MNEKDAAQTFRKLNKPDPLLRRVWFMPDKGAFRARDKTCYERTEAGEVRRQTPKVRGKAARRADKRRRKT